MDSDKINIKVSLPTDVPNGINFSLKYGNTFEILMKSYAARVGTDVNSVRFMHGQRRLKLADTTKSLGITQDAVIPVYKEYEHINLKMVDFVDTSKDVLFKVKYADSFSEIKETYCLIHGIDPITIDLYYQKCKLLDNQSPKSLEMTDGETTFWQLSNIFFIKFVFTTNTSVINVRAHRDKSVDDVLKKYADLTGLDFDTLVFFYKMKRIRKSESPNELNMESNVVVVVKIAGLELKCVGIDTFFKDVCIRINRRQSLRKLMKHYAARAGKDVTCLRFTFNGVRIKDNDTPGKLGMRKNDIIEVSKE